MHEGRKELVVFVHVKKNRLSEVSTRGAALANADSLARTILNLSALCSS
jgi:hypothetical protein